MHNIEIVPQIAKLTNLENIVSQFKSVVFYIDDVNLDEVRGYTLRPNSCVESCAMVMNRSISFQRCDDHEGNRIFLGSLFFGNAYQKLRISPSCNNSSCHLRRIVVSFWKEFISECDTKRISGRIYIEGLIKKDDIKPIRMFDCINVYKATDRYTSIYDEKLFIPERIHRDIKYYVLDVVMSNAIFDYRNIDSFKYITALSYKIESDVENNTDGAMYRIAKPEHGDDRILRHLAEQCINLKKQHSCFEKDYQDDSLNLKFKFPAYFLKSGQIMTTSGFIEALKNVQLLRWPLLESFAIISECMKNQNIIITSI